MSTVTKTQLNELYNSGKSMAEIAILLGCSVNKVVYWMDNYEIKRRGLSEALYLKLNPDGDPFTIINLVNLDDVLLFGLGLGIYWGEGSKTSKYAIRVTNTDPAMILIFTKFLERICTVKKEKMRYSIVCFNDSKVDEVREYWSKMLEISHDKFGKIVQIPPQGKGTYKKKSLYGVCTITVSNIKLKKWIMDELEKLS